MATPSGPLRAPGAEEEQAQGPAPDFMGGGPGPGGGFASPAPPQADPRSAMTMQLVLQIVANARRIGMMYPATLPEVRTIADAAARLQPKILASHPAPEPVAPPV